MLSSKNKNSKLKISHLKVSALILFYLNFRHKTCFFRNTKKMFANSIKKNCICCLSDDDRINKRINNELRKAKRKLRQTQKIVLLGVGESGKTTFLKQMQIIHGKGFTDEIKIDYRTQIYENVFRAMSGLINGKNELKLQWSNAENYENFKRFRQIHKQLMDDRDEQQKLTNTKIQIVPQQFQQAVILVKLLWNDPTIQHVYERRREYRYFVENIPYYIENIERISQPSYLPNTADILRCRRATTGINEVELIIKNVPFLFVDVGGQRTQRQKWQQCFSDVTAILFLVSSNEYDQNLREDSRTNRLDESCKVFELLINYRYLQDVSFILFLNKYDLLKEKIKKCNIKDYCQDFTGNSTNLKDVEEYLKDRFLRLKKHSYEEEDINNEDGIAAAASSSSSFKRSKYYQVNNPNGIYMRNNTLKSVDNNDQSAIYTHFTTAVDTDNIKVIFEMVKNMIFEHNRRAIMLS